MDSLVFEGLVVKLLNNITDKNEIDILNNVFRKSNYNLESKCSLTINDEGTLLSYLNIEEDSSGVYKYDFYLNAHRLIKECKKFNIEIKPNTILFCRLSSYYNQPVPHSTILLEDFK